MKLVKKRNRIELVPENVIDSVMINRIKMKCSVFTKIGGGVLKPSKMFYLYDEENDTLVISCNQLDQITKMLLENGVQYTMSESVPKVATHNLDIATRPGMEFRDDVQRDYHKYLQNDYNTYLCQLQAGKGKTGSTLLSLLSDGKHSRMLICIQPTFNNIWFDAIEKFTNIESDKIVTVSGMTELLNIDSIEDDVAVVIISSVTLRNYFDSFYSGNLDTEMRPEHIPQILGTPVMILDEPHMDFSLAYKTVLALNPKKTIMLTASYDSPQDDPVVKRFKKLIILPEQVMPKAEFDKYVNVAFMQYRFNDIHKLVYMNKYTKYYSQVMLENSILKDNTRRVNYFKMVLSVAEQFYDRKHRMLVLFSRKDMCRAFYQYLVDNELYPEKDISTYLGGDSATVLESDIIISTEKSCGTGKDIDNCQCTVNTINSKSDYFGIQVSGRNRKMKDTEQYYVTLWATNITQHGTYKKYNMDLFHTRAKKITNDYYSYPV